MMLLLGAMLGFAVSIPPTGPIALLVLRRVLQREYRRALLIGFWSTVAELPYIALGALGYGYLLEQQPHLAAAFELVGAIVLAVVGGQLLRSRADAGPPPSELRRGDALTGFALALLNPSHLLTWTAVAAIAVDPVSVQSPPMLIAYTLAVASGELAWWGLLVAGSRRWGTGASIANRSGAMRAIGAGALLLALWLFVRALQKVLA